MLIAGRALAAWSPRAAKWLLVGRHRAGEHPLWSSFVWRNELADTFVEVVAAPWFARAGTGTPALNVWLRCSAPGSAAASGARPTGCPRPTWSTCGDGATVNHGCVVQTHLFHDRVLSMDTVTLRPAPPSGPTA